MKVKRSLFLHHKSIVFRMLLSFLFLLIPLEIVGLFFLSWSKEQMQREIEASTKTSIHHLTQNIEIGMVDLFSHLARITNNSLLTEFAVGYTDYSNSEYYTNLLDQYNLLKDYPNIYLILDDVKIFYPEIQSTLSAVHGFYQDPDHVFTQIMDTMRRDTALIKGSDTSLFISDLYPASTLYTESDPLFFVTMELSYDTLVDYLNTSSQNYDTIMYLHVQNEAICSSSIESLDQYLPYLEQLDSVITDSPGKSTFTLIDSRYYVIAEYSPYLQCSFLHFIPLKEVFSVPNKISQFLLIYTLLSLPIVAVFCYVILKLIARPMENLLGGYRNVEQGDYTTALPEDTSSREFRLLTESFNEMTAHLHHSIDQVYTYQIHAQQMEIKQLQMQMNAHFLYNTYFILHRLIKYGDTEQAIQLSSYLGQYFQYITRSGQDIVPLQKEWDHAVNYIMIQQLRYTMRIRILYDPLPDKYSDFMVPRMILQPLLENALEHGMKDVQENGEVRIGFTEYENHIEFCVTDNGNTLDQSTIRRLDADIHTSDSPGKEYTALHNIHRRLRIMYGETAGLHLTEHPGGGLCVRIQIPTKINGKEEAYEFI